MRGIDPQGLTRRTAQGVALALLLTLPFVGCNQGERDNSKPIALTSNAVHDFGIVPFGSQLDHEFQVTNNTSSPILLDYLRTTCGCSDARVTPDTIAPGEIARVFVSIRADSQLGKEVLITLGSSELHPDTFLRMTLFTRVDGSERLLLDPSRLELAWPMQGQRPEGTILVQAKYRGDEAPQLIVETPDWVEAEILTSKVTETGRTQRELKSTVRVTTNSSKPSPGTKEGRLIFTTNRSSIAPVEATIRLDVEGLVQPVPPGIFLGSGIDGPVTRQVDILLASPDVRIDAKCADPRISLAYAPDPVDKKTIPLTINFDPLGGKVDNKLIDLEIQVSTTAPIHQSITLPVRGWLHESALATSE